MSMEQILIALISAVAIILAAAIPAAINARRARSEATVAREHAENMADQVIPTNGTKLHEYVERVPELIELVKETRDIAVRTDGKIDAHILEHRKRRR